MAIRRQVSCVNKRDHYNAHERIQHIGGIFNGSRWKEMESVAIIKINARTHEYYVTKNGREVIVIVATHNGRPYLKTADDGYEPNNLLSLPECP
jgi:hypothetical protein